MLWLVDSLYQIYSYIAFTLCANAVADCAAGGNRRGCLLMIQGAESDRAAGLSDSPRG